MPDADLSTSSKRWGPEPWLVAWVAGTALQLRQPELWPLMHYAVALCGLVAALGMLRGWRSVIWRHGPPLRSFLAEPRRVAAVQGCVALMIVGALAFASVGLRSAWFAGKALNAELEGRDLWVTGVVRDMPQRSLNGLRIRFQVEQATWRGVRVKVPAMWDVGWYTNTRSEDLGDMAARDALPAVHAGERWQWTVRPKAPHGARNPQGFDYELFLWEQDVQATAYVRSGATDRPPQLLGQTWRHPLALGRQMVRDRLLANVHNPQRAGVLAALAVGDQAAIDRSDWDMFRATGVSHLLSISGLHITLLGWLAGLLAAWVWRRSAALCLAVPAPVAAALIANAVALTYAVFSGWGVPAQRTCVMMLAVFALRRSGAVWPWPSVWLAACAVVVLMDPWALLQPGFWLSFIAVGVLFASGPQAHRVQALARDDLATLAPHADALRNKWVRATGSVAVGVQRMLREQWIVTLALAPLTLMLFGQVSLVGLVANLLAVPWVTLVVTPLSLLGVVIPGAWDLGAQAVAGMLAALQWLASLPLASWSWATRPWWLAVAAVAGACMLVLPWPWHMRFLGLCWIVPAVWWTPPALPEGEFSVLAMDIGQGNAVLVRTANHALLYDAGPRYSLESDAGHRVVVPLLQSRQIRLDAIVLSHRDTDHVGGAAAVMQMQPQAKLWSSLEAGHPLLATRAHQRCQAGDHWVWDGVTFAVLHPGEGLYAAQARPNALSCVLRVDNGRHSALLVGDIEAPQEAALIAQARDGPVTLQSDVLLVPHHGSKTSSSEAFLDAVQPRMALVQAGYRNRFGHPAPVVMDRYSERHVMVRDSPHCGAAQWFSGSADQLQCERELDRHYWSHRLP